MKHVVVIPNPKKDTDLAVTEALTKKLLHLGAAVYIEDRPEFDKITSASRYVDFPTATELIIVVGGDGSVLDASMIAIERDIPILGVNLGKVGYLSEIEPDNLDILSGIISDEYKIEEKMLLSVYCNKCGAVTSSARCAVNDVIISHDTFLGIADFTLENDMGDCVKYRADGMILSTPAGSTAYNLSAGGPIVSHDVDSIVATPICPHSFFNRSIIFKSGDRIKLKNTSDTELNVSVDGRYFASLKNGDECVVCEADKKLKMLTFTKNNMFTTLFKKIRILDDIK
ncbi:MAG: NAD(+)/NADH kinase [Clostridia bacterium]|nr:NAD(+)/NADH kinase [Clostridia bacterium]